MALVTQFTQPSLTGWEQRRATRAAALIHQIRSGDLGACLPGGLPKIQYKHKLSIALACQAAAPLEQLSVETVLFEARLFSERVEIAGRESLSLRVAPRQVMFGGADESEAQARTMALRYDSSGWNEALALPHSTRQQLLWYAVQWEVLQPAGGVHERVWGARAWLRAGERGSWVRVPLRCSAPFPWRPAHFTLKTATRLPAAASAEAWACGRATAVYWGFFPLAALAAGDSERLDSLPWVDALGRAGHAGEAAVLQRHSGRHMGPFAAPDLWVRVPAGALLLFRAAYDQFDERGTRLASRETATHAILAAGSSLQASALSGRGATAQDGAR